MAWFQVDDQLAMHRKVCEAGNAAMGLWVRAGSWSMANLTEGFVPAKAAKTLGTAGQARALVESGLWVVIDGGYQFHEWGTRQMSAEQIAERRRKRAEAGRKGGQSKRGDKPEAKPKADAQASASEIPKQNVTPVPVPALEVVTSGGNGTEVDASDFANGPPPKFCPKHPNGTDRPCGGCADHRDARKRWDAEHAERITATRRTFWAEVHDCDACDAKGWELDDDGQTADKPRRCLKHDWSVLDA